jgi:hypothetical protein
MSHSTTHSASGKPADAPIRDDWAYLTANDIYAVVTNPGHVRPTEVIDLIATELRRIRLAGEMGVKNMLDDIARDWGVL